MLLFSAIGPLFTKPFPYSTVVTSYRTPYNTSLDIRKNAASDIRRAIDNYYGISRRPYLLQYLLQIK